MAADAPISFPVSKFALTGVLLVALTAGCASRSDPVAQAAKADAAKGIAAPGFAETAQIV